MLTFLSNKLLHFQLVHQDHQLIDFGDDPALFGEWGNGDW